MKPDQERVRNLLLDTVTLLCRNGLNFRRQMKVQGLLGITLDDDDVFIVHINERVNESSTFAASSIDDDPIANSSILIQQKYREMIDATTRQKNIEESTDARRIDRQIASCYRGTAIDPDGSCCTSENLLTIANCSQNGEESGIPIVFKIEPITEDENRHMNKNASDTTAVDQIEKDQQCLDPVTVAPVLLFSSSGNITADHQSTEGVISSSPAGQDSMPHHSNEDIFIPNFLQEEVSLPALKSESALIEVESISDSDSDRRSVVESVSDPSPEKRQRLSPSLIGPRRASSGVTSSSCPDPSSRFRPNILSVYHDDRASTSNKVLSVPHVPTTSATSPQYTSQHHMANFFAQRDQVFTYIVNHIRDICVSTCKSVKSVCFHCFI